MLSYYRPTRTWKKSLRSLRAFFSFHSMLFLFIQVLTTSFSLCVCGATNNMEWNVYHFIVVRNLENPDLPTSQAIINVICRNMTMLNLSFLAKILSISFLSVPTLFEGEGGSYSCKFHLIMARVVVIVETRFIALPLIRTMFVVPWPIIQAIKNLKLCSESCDSDCPNL